MKERLNIFYIMFQSISNIWPVDTAHPSHFRASDRPRSMIDTPLFFLSLCIRLSVCLYIYLCMALITMDFPDGGCYTSLTCLDPAPHTRESRSIFFQKYVYFLKGQFHRIFSTYFCGYRVECVCYILRFGRLFSTFGDYFWRLFFTNAWSTVIDHSAIVKVYKILLSPQHCAVCMAFLLFFILHGDNKSIQYLTTENAPTSSWHSPFKLFLIFTALH
jgi:hypothetical protein